MSEFDCDFRDNIVCPYCGYTNTDSWEINFGSNEDTETDCGMCSTTFRVSRHVDISYSSSKLEEGAGDERVSA